MHNRLYRFFVFALMLAFAMSGMNLTASAYGTMQANSFILYNQIEYPIVEVYIFPTNSGRGLPRNHVWIHSGSSGTINFSSSDLNSYASWSMTIGYKAYNNMYTIRWDNLSPRELVNAGHVTISTNYMGGYILDYSSPYYTDSNNYTTPMAPSITQCINAGRLRVNASSWFRGNNPSVDPSKMMDGNIRTSWDSDNERYPDFWFTATDGNEYTLKGFRIVNGKDDEYYFYRNDRVAELELYVDGRYIQNFRINNERAIYQTLWLDTPVSGTEFFFHVSRVYTSNHPTRTDLVIAEFEPF